MLERRSPLTGYALPVSSGPTGEAPGIRLSEQPLGGLVQVSGWSDSFEVAVMPALDRLGFSGAGDFRNMQTANEAQVMRVAPNRLLLRHANPLALADVVSCLDVSRALTLDLSSARSVIRIEGLHAVQVMVRLSSVDFGFEAFPVTGFAQTGIHHVGVLIQRIGHTRFDILVPTTWALSVWEMARETATPFCHDVV